MARLRDYILAIASATAAVHATVARADVPDVADAFAAGDCKAAGAAINRGLDRGDAQAFYFAGVLFDATGCVEADPARAARYYKRGAELGNREAADALGLSYGLGHGVERDYAEAWRWFSAARKSAPEPNAGVVDARVAGYAATVSHVALGKVRYPFELERANVESSFEVMFVPATGDFSVRNVRTALEVGSNVPRSRIFIDVVRDAYRDAVREVPRPDGARPVDTFVTPWRFAMRRGKYDERLAAQGAVTVGDTTVADAR